MTEKEKRIYKNRTTGWSKKNTNKDQVESTKQKMKKEAKKRNMRNEFREN